MKLLEIKNLKKSFKKRLLFEGVNVTIDSGTMVAIQGNSGSGKTTFLNIIGMLEDFDAGEIKLFGKKIPKANSKGALLLRREKISYLFQNFALFEDETIEKNLNVAMLYSKLSRAEKRKKMKEVLEKVNVAHSLSTRIYSLSGGEKQRVAVARSLLKSSDLLLADEPTGSVDKTNRNEIMKLLRGDANLGKTVIVVTHDPEVVEQCDFVFHIGQ
ncbi:MAG: putative bacteriocin export ABC transporter [Streptococcaceae bacterium]|jgi:putative ABC transport system ATP-binding protein|nr:putative bacteriocin export ABC transporter [Streptococcaceae bacterium]